MRQRPGVGGLLAALALATALAVAPSAPAQAQAGPGGPGGPPGPGGASGCSILSTTSINFGLYDPMGMHQAAPLDAVGAIHFECAGSVKALAISIDQGLAPAPGSSCASPRRQMTSGIGRLEYQLHADAAHTQPWGCAPANEFHPAMSSGRTELIVPIHGRIQPAQDPDPGVYSDTLTITLIF